MTVLTNDPYFAGSVNMSLSAPSQHNQQYSLKLTITPATHVTQDIQVEVSFGSVPQPIAAAIALITELLRPVWRKDPS